MRYIAICLNWNKTNTKGLSLAMKKEDVNVLPAITMFPANHLICSNYIRISSKFANSILICFIDLVIL